MTQLLMQGTGFTNFIGKYCYVAAGEHGFEAVVVTESTEPQAVIGSSLQKIAYPENYEEHLEHGRELEHSHEHPGRDIIESLIAEIPQARDSGSAASRRIPLCRLRRRWTACL